MSTHVRKIKDDAAALRATLAALPVPGVLDLSDAPWKPCNLWVRRHAQAINGTFSVRRFGRKFFVFRLE